MKIEQSAVHMDAAHSATKISHTETVSNNNFSLVSKNFVTSNSPLADSHRGPERFSFANPSTLIYIPANNSTITIEESFHDINQRLLRHIIQMMHDMLEGRNFTNQSRSEFLTEDSEAHRNRQVWYQSNSDTYSFYSESELTTYHTDGLVRTSDGREISFGLDLSMSRAFMRETKISEKTDDVLQFHDPLVINMDVPSAAVTDQSFLFDINGDGTKEKIASLQQGSGFLAYDKNGDGIINNGSELFGTQSGDGFRELAAYDLDGNGWIDENDEIFGKLKVWTKNYDGTDKLLSLREADIGAIFLGSISTDFDLNSLESNDTLAKIRSTGIFLHETTGKVGTVQHVDFSA